MTAPSDASAHGERARIARISELRARGSEALPELLDELVEPTWAVRRAVVAALSEAEPAGMPLLCAALASSRENEAKLAGLVDALSATRNDVDELVLALAEHENVAVLCDAAQILGRRESTRAIPRLAQLTGHTDDNVALAAVEALGRIGGRAAVDALLPLAASRNFFRTFPTIDVLGRSRDVRALPTLFALVADPLYAGEAVRALGRLGDPSAVPVLLEYLGRSPASLVSAIALALVAIHETSEQRFGTGAAVEHALMASPRLADVRRQLTLALKRADPSEQLALSQTLAWVGEESTVPTLIDLLRAPAEVASIAAASLKRLGAIAEPQLIEALHSGSSELRRALVPILSGKLAALDELIECLADDDSTVRALACDALARTSDPAAVPALFELLSEADARVGQAALAAIQSLGSDGTRRLALAGARSNDLRLRRAGLRIIGYFGYPEGLEALTEASQSSDEKLRDAAISGLPFIDGPEATSVLLGAANHESPRTRTAAVRALGHTAGEPLVRERLRAALADADAWVRYYACQALGRLKDDASTPLIAARLSDEFGQVRVAAVEALAHLRGAQAFEVLSGVLASDDVDLFRAALVALGLSKRVEALPHLLSALSSANAATRLVALSALAELGLPEALPAIAQATRDSDEGVRVAATGFLAARSDASATAELINLLSDDPSRQDLVRALARPQPGRSDAIAAALLAADDALAASLVAALARMHTEAPVLAIRRALASPNDAARRAAASALIAMQDGESMADLERAALSDPDAEVRRICAASLVR